ncbi:hypothetical protein NMY22_g14605 [Coprinellus aureogranulatus]|nr:hypothetical protein NMY22_g14605 [Coprinellus aureogranulatus]
MHSRRDRRLSQLQDLHAAPLENTEQAIIRQGSIINTNNIPPTLVHISGNSPVALNLAFLETLEEHEDTDSQVRGGGNVQWRSLLIRCLREEAESNKLVLEERGKPVPEARIVVSVENPEQMRDSDARNERGTSFGVETQVLESLIEVGRQLRHLENDGVARVYLRLVRNEAGFERSLGLFHTRRRQGRNGCRDSLQGSRNEFSFMLQGKVGKD